MRSLPFKGWNLRLAIACTMICIPFPGSGALLESPDVEKGSPPGPPWMSQIDGTASLPQGVVVHAIDDGEVALQVTDDLIRVELRTGPLHVAHVYLGTADHVVVLHASAALGKIEFRRQADRWGTDAEEFVWRVRTTANDAQAVQRRADHFREQGWIASTTGMGKRGVVEFAIDRGSVPPDCRIAVAVMTATEPITVLAWPASRKDGIANSTLVRGDVPARIDFEPSKWWRLETAP